MLHTISWSRRFIKHIESPEESDELYLVWNVSNLFNYRAPKKINELMFHGTHFGKHCYTKQGVILSFMLSFSELLEELWELIIRKNT